MQSPRVITCVAAWGAALLLCLQAGCGGGVSVAQGREGGPCYPNDTCDTGLVCEAGVCVLEPCTEGETQSCTCTGGESGTQTCDADGEWSTCDCSPACDAGTADCDGDPSNGCETTLGTVDHCGDCDDVCSEVNATATCDGTGCLLTCDAGFDNCDGDATNGCEADLNDPMTCGDCLTQCSTGCTAGVCDPCDAGLAVDTNDPLEAAAALGICGGVTDAQWVLPDGAVPPVDPDYDLGHGLLDGFGPNVNPQEGNLLLGLSSGSARQPTDPGYQSPQDFDKGYSCGHPTGFPKESPACPGVTTGEPHDGAALELTLQVPPTAQGLSFDFNFYTYEWPQYICSAYNDFFVAILDPLPAGQTDGNISFDSQGNPVSVNNSLLEVCDCAGGPPCVTGGKTFNCSLGAAELLGTGFGVDTEGTDHAATGWLRTTAPVAPGTTITLRFGIYDSGDGILNSSVLLDNFRWLNSTTVVNTVPIPNPL